MFKGLKVIPLKNKTIVSLYPQLDMIFRFRTNNGLLITDRYDAGVCESNLYDPELPIIKLCDNDDFKWLQGAFDEECINIVKFIDYKQITTFNALMCSRELRELFDSSPVLVWLLVCNMNVNQSFHTLSYLCLRKRRDLLSKITGNVCQAKHVKFVSKIQLDQGTEQDIKLVIESLKDNDVVDSFRHRVNVRISELYLISVYPFLLGSCLLPKLADRKRDTLSSLNVGIANIIQTYQDTIDLGRSLDFKDSKRIVASCDSETKLYHLHNQWIKLLNESRSKLDRDIKFGLFPADDTEQFKYISSVNELIDEGRVMDHCAATYRDRVLKNQSYLFRVMYPERATLELGFGGGEYYLKQLKLRSNNDPSNNTFSVVNAWIKKVNDQLASTSKKIS